MSVAWAMARAILKLRAINWEEVSSDDGKSANDSISECSQE